MQPALLSSLAECPHLCLSIGLPAIARRSGEAGGNGDRFNCGSLLGLSGDEL